MEKDVEKLYDDVLNSINCENDEFINSYFENEEINTENQVNTMLNDGFEDEWLEEISVENYVENVDKKEENNENKEEKPVENFENEFNNNDFESLIASSEEFDNVMVDVNSYENDIDLENKEEIHLEEPILEEVEIKSTEDLYELTNDDILSLIDKTDNSEEFFEKLEDKLDD